MGADPRITRTTRAFEHAIVELAGQRPVSQITVAELADRAGVTRATFYNRYTSPLDLLIQVLYADLERTHALEQARRAQGGTPPRNCCAWPPPTSWTTSSGSRTSTGTPCATRRTAACTRRLSAISPTTAWPSWPGAPTPACP